jgi:arginine-tRNA-protein transferase
MLFSYAEKNTPFTLSPQSLDWHLARAWYRMGSTIFTTHFLFFHNRPYSAIWIRIDLRGFAFSKSQRKLLRKNAQLFSVQTGPAVLNAEREDLYQRYAADFDGHLSPTLRDSLEDYGEDTVFQTHEITVRDRVSGQLVASSYFDLGDRSAASILGIFDPKLRTFSLGYYTMLLEMQHCMEQGMHHYYPGYVVPGYDRFNYKLRLGPAQYFDLRSGEWLDYQHFLPEREGPVEAQEKALRQFIADYRSTVGRTAELKIYPLFEAGLYDIWNDDYFPYPYLVNLSDTPGKYVHVVAFDPKQRQFLLLRCRHMVQTQLLFNAEYLRSFRTQAFATDLLAVRRIEARSGSSQEIVERCLHLLGR